MEGGITDHLYLDWNRVDGRMPQDYDVRDGILFITDVRSEVNKYDGMLGFFFIKVSSVIITDSLLYRMPDYTLAKGLMFVETLCSQ